MTEPVNLVFINMIKVLDIDAKGENNGTLYEISVEFRVTECLIKESKDQIILNFQNQLNYIEKTLLEG